MTSAAFYIAPNQACVARAERELSLAGLPKGELSVLGIDGRVYGTRVLKAAAVCAVLGGVLGGTLAWAFDLRGATYTTGSFQEWSGAFALLLGVAVGAAAGSLTGSLVGLGIPSSRAQHSLRKGGRGSVLVSVHAHDEDDARRVERILSEVGAVPVPTAEMSTRFVAIPPDGSLYASSVRSD
ncbi:MAG: hypothetical protein IPJ77_21605 [Planctomycetes bacterium]|nr:hypothetical protein [Planctomycetota bacterium]